MLITKSVLRTCRVGITALILALSLSGCSYRYWVVFHNGSGDLVYLEIIENRSVVADRFPIPNFGSVRIDEFELGGFRIAGRDSVWHYSWLDHHYLEHETEYGPPMQLGYVRHASDGAEYHLGIGPSGELIALKINEEGEVTSADAKKQPQGFPMRPEDANPS